MADRVRIYSEGIFFAGRGRAVAVVPKEFGALGRYMSALGLEKITDGQFDELIKK